MLNFLENFEIIDFMISSISFADHSPAVGLSEDQTYKLPFNQFSQNIHKNKSKSIILQLLQHTGCFLLDPPYNWTQHYLGQVQ